MLCVWLRVRNNPTRAVAGAGHTRGARGAHARGPPRGAHGLLEHLTLGTPLPPPPSPPPRQFVITDAANGCDVSRK